ERMREMEGALARDRAEGEGVAAELRACASQEAEIQRALHDCNETVTRAEVRAQQLRDQEAEAAHELGELAGKLGLEAQPREEPPPAPVLGGHGPAHPADNGDGSAEVEAEAAAEAAADAEAEAVAEGGIDPDDDLGVEIEITPAGKSMKRLTLLSGGEKTMTAIAFLFAVFLARPCPFYILDEVEAALDDLNIGRFLELLRANADRAQFIVVTHQKRTMEAADTLYGVSMGDDGVSKVVSRKLPREVVAAAEAA